MSNNKKFFLNPEQIQAHQQDARKNNPNLARIQEIQDKIRELYKELNPLISDTEKYYNIMYWLANTEETRALVSLMEPREIGEHLINLFDEHCKTELDNAILDRALELIGYDIEENHEDEKKDKK